MQLYNNQECFELINYNNNQQCFELIHSEINRDPSFLPYRNIELDKYIEKLDKLASFEKYYIEDVLAGFTAFYCNDTINKRAFITLVLIHPKYRDRGISKELMNRTLSFIEDNGFLQCSLEVKIENTKAINLYKSFGFIVENQTETVLFMTKRIS